MNDKTREELREFFTICFNRFQFGQKTYGDRYEDIDLLDEMITELADVVNYAFLQYLKLKKMKNNIKESK